MNGSRKEMSVLVVITVFGAVTAQVGVWGWKKWKRRNKPTRRPVPSMMKSALYEKQRGTCNGCEEKFAKRNLEVDHIFPLSKGGQTEPANLQLLCGHCNRVKGDRTQEYLLKNAKRRGQLQ